ncbi:MAG: hypothetical protein JXA51_06430 [Dehalococcoidales bacterium]|nr:hypothetical protein [Dehalococcoidales bacterium]
MLLEKMGKPGVFINCTTFDDDARSASADNGMPTVRRVKISSEDFYKLRGEVETVRPLVESVFDEIIDALTKPLTAEDMDTSAVESEDEAYEITVTAESYPEAAEEFNRIYLDNRWGDGLPMVPPTPERVKWMLTGTKRKPDEVLGKINPKQGIATIEKIAVNAVMAGAKPEYLPVIIAVIEALTDDDFDDLHILASAGSFNLLMVVSGPIAREIDMESGIGFMGHGWRPNNTIGRAIRLSTLNIGRTWPGMNDMALTGRVSPHTFFTICEAEDFSPWEPYHSGRGFKSGDSCVTVCSIHGESQLNHFYGGMIGTWTAEGVLDRMVEDITRTDRRTYPMWGTKGWGKYLGSGIGAMNHMIVLFPELAAELKKMGYDQKGLQDEVYKRTCVPYDDLNPAERRSLQTAIELGVIPTDRKAVFESALKPGGKVPVMIEPENLHFFVAGGAPGCAFSFNYYRVPPYNRTALMTKKITGAALTKVGA